MMKLDRVETTHVIPGIPSEVFALWVTEEDDPNFDNIELAINVTHDGILLHGYILDEDGNEVKIGEKAFSTDELLRRLEGRKTCSCGEGWADEPGHDDDQEKTNRDFLANGYTF